MNKGFWEKLKKPIFALAPMYDVTDTAFRRVIAEQKAPDVFYTEFVSTDGLCSAGHERLVKDLAFGKIERPIVAQIFGNNSQKFYDTAKILVELGFDGIDINMGCPEKTITKTGSGAGLILEPKLAKEIIQATQEGVGELPVSVKTRIGYDRIQTEEWIGYLLELDLPALAVHVRTRKDMSQVPARWDEMTKIMELAKGKKTRILGNGDLWTYQDALEKIETYGMDGVMIGRGIFGNPWFFDTKRDKSEVSKDEIFDVLIRHCQYFEKYVSHKNFDVMKKHFGSYVSGMKEAKKIKIALMETKTSEEVTKVLQNFRND
jgi:nifR3 family TIM-barrel protein